MDLPLFSLKMICFTLKSEQSHKIKYLYIHRDQKQVWAHFIKEKSMMHKNS